MKLYLCVLVFMSKFARHGKLLSQGSSVSQVVSILRTEGTITTCQTIWHFDQHIKEHGHANSLPKSGRPTMLSAGDLKVINCAMKHYDVTTWKEILTLIEENIISITEHTAYRA